MSEPRIIKKYGNRRLYCTSESRYVSLTEVAELLRSGEDVQVVDAKTGLVTSHAVQFYTTAFYKYTGSGAGGKVGQQYGFVLQGVSDETFQAIADETGAYLEEKLVAFGYTLGDFDAFLQAKGIEKLQGKAETPGVEMEVENPNYSKKVKARTFTKDNQAIYPTVVGNTAWFKVVPSMDMNAVITKFSINFLSLGHQIESSTLFDEGTTTGQMTTESSVHGVADIEILTPKLKFGELNTYDYFRHPSTDGFTVTGEIQDGFYVIQADEAKYKQYAVELINGYIDLMFAYMADL